MECVCRPEFGPNVRRTWWDRLHNADYILNRRRVWRERGCSPRRIHNNNQSHLRQLQHMYNGVADPWGPFDNTLYSAPVYWHRSTI